MADRTLFSRLLDAQKEIGAIKRENENSFFKGHKYADINAVLAVIKPILNSHGLVIIQPYVTKEICGTRVTGIETLICDVESDKSISFFCEMPTFVKPQEIGSAITYFRRYCLISLMSLESEDDDGNLANGNVVEKKSSYTPKATNPNVKKFEEDMQVVPEDLILYTEKIEATNNLTELRKVWDSLPPLVKTALATKKEEQKFKLA
jgi:hypothetical protein